MKTRYDDYDYKLQTNSYRLTSKRYTLGADTKVCRIKGCVATRYGNVFVSSFSNKKEGEKETGHTFLIIVKGGREHYRRYNRPFSMRGLVTKAKLFARDVFTG